MNQSSVNPFKKASKSQSRLRLGLVGVSGSGKTFSALAIGSALAAHYDGRVALIDTEHGSASKYADRFSFDVLELVDFNPKNYIDAIKAASDYYDVLIIDSLSHAWSGSGGVLEMVDNAAKRSQSNNSFTAWRDVTPLHEMSTTTRWQGIGDGLLALEIRAAAALAEIRQWGEARRRLLADLRAETAQNAPGRAEA